MKKLTITLVLLLGLTMGMFAQGFIENDRNQVEKGLFGRGLELFREEQEAPFLPPYHGSLENHDAAAPLGSGIAVLVGLGAAYVIAMKRKEE